MLHARHQHDAEQIIAADPCGVENPALVAAAGRAGGTGLLDIRDSDQLDRLRVDLRRRDALGCWLRPAPELDAAAADLGSDAAGFPVAVLALSMRPGADLPALVAGWSAGGSRRVVAQVTSRAEAEAAVAAGVHGLLASGSEAGGVVGPTEAFVLFQQVVDLGVPVWLRGGIGLHTAAAVIAGGGAGVVVDTQLGLLRESSLDHDARQALAAMDGSETRVVAGIRFYTRPDLPAHSLAPDTDRATVAALLGPDLRTQLVPFGQDSGFAAGLAERHHTVGGVVQALRAAITDHLAAAAAAPPLAPGAGVSAAHGTRYPIAQGPMTRVSDRAAFAASVAEGGGLPFLALALLPGEEVRALLTETRDLLGDRPWGVGILGFVPAELRAEQLAVVHEIAPPVALIAGGRPSQAVSLEEAGIATYLHVPSPGLLDRFLKDGARSFIFEGRECGGHVGPRSSFALWDAQIERLLEVEDAASLKVMLAGGIHDARSAAMAAAALAPLAAKGAQVGVLMGTAYLFTAEAVAGGAIQPAFQDVALECDTTVLLETAPGHATRCVETDFVRAFASRKAELEAAGVEPGARWAELEQLNLGRLRIAAKGLERGAAGLGHVAEDRQRAEGMYMIGEVATLRSEVTTVATLHAEVSAGSAAWAREHAAPALEVAEPQGHPLDVAIIGMDSFFPGAVGAEEFWSQIVAATDQVTEVSAERWDTDLYYSPDAFAKDAGAKTPSKWGGFLRRIGFNPLAYGIPPASLAAIEPVQLLSLEVASRALADAGYARRHFDRERASVIFGAESGNELGGAYGARAFLPQLFGSVPPELDQWLPTLTEDSFPGVLANVIAGRIANRLDLGGVNYTVDAACASSLAALDAACKELVTGQSDLVLAGGADLHNGLNDYLMFSSVHALSPTGRCRTFDAGADGIALGEGIACVVLKRRVDAERDGDRIYAVIDAVSGSSDGRHLGLTAPRKEGQQRAVVRALAQAGTDIGEVGLVEAHGTGTVVGDRTEMATLTELFAEAGVAPGSVVLGSVKSQIGHTKCAAGLAGLIKVAKAVHHGVLPPTINLVDPNPYYDAERSPFRFHDTARPWPAEKRRAGVSAFGFGGTNFHALVSSYDGGDRPAYGLTQWGHELFLVRGTSAEDAARTCTELAGTVAQILESDPEGQRHPLRDLAATVSRAGRGPVRVALVASSLDDLATGLGRVAGGTDARHGVFVADPEAGSQAPKVGFLYPGQGSQRPGMLNDLFVTFSGLDDLLRLGARWTDTMFPPTAFSREEKAAQQAAITATDVAQPTLGIASLAMTRLLRRFGVEPDVAGGHSYGELAALAAAGSFDDATLLELSAARGGAVLGAIERSGGDPGTMAAIALPLAEVTERLAAWPTLVVANHNGPKQVVVSGPTEAVHEAVAALAADGVRATVIPVACAFHSPLVAAAGEILGERLADLPVAAPRFPVWSNTTAEPYPADDPDAVRRLLTEQVTAGVRFVDQVESMYAAGVRVFVEAGPGRVLSQQVAKILGDRPHHVVACESGGEPGLRRFLTALAELATLGVPVDPTGLFAGRATPLDLHALPVAAPAWTVDGAFVRRADGTPLPNSYQPANTMPAPDLAPRGPEGDPVIYAASGPVVQAEAEPATPAAEVRAIPAAPAVPATPAAEVPAASQAAPVSAPAQPSPVPQAPLAAAPAPLAPVQHGDGATSIVHEYLRSVRQIVAAERDVVLRYLGSAVPVSGAFDESTYAPPVREVAAETPPRRGNIGFEGVAEATNRREPRLGGYPDTAATPAAPAPAPAPMPAPVTPTPAAPAPAIPAPAATPALSGAALMQTVQGVVSDRTGYPIEMLEPDLDLEADLSIDSIKRIEIVGELAERIGLGGLDESGLDEAAVEELSRHKTLRSIVEWVEALQSAPVPAAPAPAAVPDAVPAAAVAAPEPLATPSLSGAELLRAVQSVVSDRTGYPIEMLEPDLDLEADLSIDSIKRIEIVGELAERIGLAALSSGGADELDESVVEELSSHKTLRAIVEWIEGVTAAPTASPAAPAPVPAPAPAAAAATVSEPEVHLPVGTQLFDVAIEPLGPTVALGDLRGAEVALLEGHAQLTGHVEAALAERGARVLRLPATAASSHADALSGVDALVDLTATAGDPSVDARGVFAAVRPALLGKVRRVLAVTVPLHADGTPTGVPGLMRALARERTDVLLRSVEIETADLRHDLIHNLAPLAVTLVDELLDLDAPAAVSWAGGQRTSRVVRAPREVPADYPSLDLTPESVVVVTGGARGITARVAEGLARTAPCRVVLVGRSPFPTEDEDPRTAAAQDTVSLRRALLEIGELRTPAEIEAACARIEAAREMRATLATLKSVAAEVDYVPMDVRSPAFGALLDALHAQFGRIDAVIHGAGVLDDRLVVDKTAEGFDRVYGTKVDGARAILERQHLGMRFVVLFGSVSGVFGNKGQCDYASANDALDTLARTHDGVHGCRVVSLDWGPWAGGGMVSAELEREYARRGIGLVDPTDGVRALLHEVAGGHGGSQVVVMRGNPEAFAPPVDHSSLGEELLQDSRSRD
ncbi:type I polyketide synthase [Nocardioides sp. 616]|uniref:type I polyketide synthase n=1 Tax=Nocardioides sp. 616 TaxID=2268090 RepID=UPI0019635B93|nr:type I polyketide synthase [Nocardioides sp. 616]